MDRFGTDDPPVDEERGAVRVIDCTGWRRPAVGEEIRVARE
jgi:hypothetical protein